MKMSADALQESEEEEKVTKVKMGIVDYIAGNNFFIMQDDLPPPEKELKYTYIVVKHGMVAPEVLFARTFPTDPNYKDSWQPGSATRRGRSLMLMVGRSLYTRYGKFLKTSTTWDQIRFSSVAKEYAIKLSAQLGFGLLQDTDYQEEFQSVLSEWLEVNEYSSDIEKLHTVSADCPWMKILHDAYEQEINSGTKTLTTCRDDLYEILNQIIPIENYKQREWKMDSPSRIYKLWSMIIFEALQGQKEPTWAKHLWSEMQACVFEFYRNLLLYHPAIPAIQSGRIIHQMEKELRGGQSKFHVHVTNDLGALSMNWTLPESKQDYWPDPGDALLFDFYTDNTVGVFSFSGWHRTFNKIYEVPKREFFREYKNRNMQISEEVWQKICVYDGRTIAPKNIHSSFFLHPLRPMKRDIAIGSDESGESSFNDVEGGTLKTAQLNIEDDEDVVDVYSNDNVGIYFKKSKDVHVNDREEDAEEIDVYNNDNLGIYSKAKYDNINNGLEEDTEEIDVYSNDNLGIYSKAKYDNIHNGWEEEDNEVDVYNNDDLGVYSMAKPVEMYDDDEHTEDFLDGEEHKDVPLNGESKKTSSDTMDGSGVENSPKVPKTSPTIEKTPKEMSGKSKHSMNGGKPPETRTPSTPPKPPQKSPREISVLDSADEGKPSVKKPQSTPPKPPQKKRDITVAATDSTDTPATNSNQKATKTSSVGQGNSPDSTVGKGSKIKEVSITDTSPTDTPVRKRLSKKRNPPSNTEQTKSTGQT